MTPTRALVRQLFEQQDTTLTLEIGPFGDGSPDTVNVGPNGGFSSDAFVMSFEGGSNQHAFTPGDAGHVRQLIQAMKGWLDWVETGQVKTVDPRPDRRLADAEHLIFTAEAVLDAIRPDNDVDKRAVEKLLGFIAKWKVRPR